MRLSAAHPLTLRGGDAPRFGGDGCSRTTLQQGDFGNVGVTMVISSLSASTLDLPRDGWGVLRWQHPAEQGCEPLGSQAVAVCAAAPEVPAPTSRMVFLIPSGHAGAWSPSNMLCTGLQTPDGLGSIREPPAPPPPPIILHLKQH